MTDPVLSADEAALQRRRFLRGGALLAAAAGGAVAASVSNAQPAAAATGDPVVAGTSNTAFTTTTIETSSIPTATSDVPALSVANISGPSLRLLPIKENSAWDGRLPVGGLLGTNDGPYIGLEDEDGNPFTSYLATGEDLAYTPSTAPVPPRRVWDSKAKKGTVVASSAKAIDAKGRLVKGAWVDIKVLSTNSETTPVGAFVTVGSAKSTKDGSLTVYAPGGRPGTISLSFLAGKTMAAGAYTAVGVSGSSFVVRVYASQTTYVTLDLTGLSSLDVPGPGFTGSAQRTTGARALRAARPSRRAQR